MNEISWQICETHLKKETISEGPIYMQISIKITHNWLISQCVWMCVWIGGDSFGVQRWLKFNRKQQAKTRNRFYCCSLRDCVCSCVRVDEIVHFGYACLSQRVFLCLLTCCSQLTWAIFDDYMMPKHCISGSKRLERNNLHF